MLLQEMTSNRDGPPRILAVFLVRSDNYIANSRRRACFATDVVLWLWYESMHRGTSTGQRYDKVWKLSRCGTWYVAVCVCTYDVV